MKNDIHSVLHTSVLQGIIMVNTTITLSISVALGLDSVSFGGNDVWDNKDSVASLKAV